MYFICRPFRMFIEILNLLDSRLPSNTLPKYLPSFRNDHQNRFMGLIFSVLQSLAQLGCVAMNNWSSKITYNPNDCSAYLRIIILLGQYEDFKKCFAKNILKG